MMDEFYQMYSAYKLRKPGQKLEDTEWSKSEAGKSWNNGVDKNIIIKVVGVFDTVR
jgi:Uncharacterized alpha/beta hydrolase domain (DUF2235)